MLTYHFKNNKPKYEQLYSFIKEDILSGKISGKLPSKRQLAKHLDISIITVQNAYEQLLIEGYIYTVEKKGYYVQKLDFIPGKIKKITEKKVDEDFYKIDLKNNAIAPSNFPYATWSKLTREILASKDKLLLKRAPYNGILALRKAIQNHLFSFLGLDVSVEQIVIGSGSEYLYNCLIELLGKDYLYAYENPGHKSIRKIYEMNGCRHLPINLDEDGLSVKELIDSKADVVHITPSHNFPTGITMPIKRRLEIYNYISDRGYIIEDDYDSEFRLHGNPIPSLFQIANGNRVIYMNTFSKTLAPSFRISYMVLPNDLLSKYQKMFLSFASSVSTIDQMVLAKFIDEGYFERHLSRVRNYYKNIRNRLLEGLNKINNIEIKEENAGLHFIILHHLNVKDEALIKKAKKLGLNIITISSYYEKPFISHQILINYAGLTLEDVPLTIKLLKKLLKDN